MRNTARVAVVLLACGCGPSSPPSTPARPNLMTTAELWSLAPEGVVAGVVYAPGQGAALQRTMNEIIESLRSTKVEIPALEKMVRETAALNLSNGQVPGYDPDTETASFFGGDEEVYKISRVGDRAAMRAALKGTTDGDVDVYEIGGERSVCEPKGELYYCAPNVDALKAWKPGATPLGKNWPADLRGPIELFIEIAETAPTPSARIYARSRFERGKISIDFATSGLPKTLPSAPAPLAKARLARSRNGHLQINPALVKLALSEIPNEDLEPPLPNGVTAGSVVSALTGEVVSTFHVGGGELAIGVNDPGPFRALISACDLALPALTARREGDACLVEAPLPGGERLRARLRVTNTAVVASFGAARTDAAPRVEAPDRLVETQWLVAGWLRGVGNNAAALEPLAAHLDARAMTLLRWSVAHISEVGFGFRFSGDQGRGFFEVVTSWSNPPEVVARLEPLLGQIARGQHGALADIDRLAAAHPKSVLAIDRSLGDHRPLFAPAALAFVEAATAAARQQETARDVIEEFNGLRADMCDCEDRACAESVNARFEAWLKQNEQVKGSAKQQERAKAIAVDYTECMMEAFKPPPPSGPDEP